MESEAALSEAELRPECEQRQQWINHRGPFRVQRAPPVVRESHCGQRLAPRPDLCLLAILAKTQITPKGKEWSEGTRKPESMCISLQRY